MPSVSPCLCGSLFVLEIQVLEIQRRNIDDTPNRTPPAYKWSHPHRTRTLDLISELVGQSFRKSIDRLILGNVLPDTEWSSSFKDIQKSREKE